MATLSSTPAPTPASLAAEALLARARILSSTASKRSRYSMPSLPSFTHGEDINVDLPTPSSTRSPSSPGLTPVSTLSSASLHQLHRNSFNDIVRDHGGRRQFSHQQRVLSYSSPISIPTTGAVPRESSRVSTEQQRQQRHSSHPIENTPLTSMNTKTTTTTKTTATSTTMTITTTAGSDQQAEHRAEPSPSSQAIDRESTEFDGRTNDDNNRAQTVAPPVCATPKTPMARHSLTITSWSGSESPALEVIREGQDHHLSQSDGSGPYATDAHRRRRSDSSQLCSNRGRLVMGILEALRDNDDAPSDKKISAGPSSFTTPSPSVTVSAHPHVPLKDTQADSIAKPRPASMATPTQWANASPALESAHGSELQMGITYSGTTAISAAAPVTIPTIATTAYAPGGSPIARRRDPDAPAPPPKPTPVANGGNLRRTSRSESVYSQDNMDLSSSTSDNGSIFSSSSRRTSLVPATPIISSSSSVTAAANMTKGARRPSKLFGKLVPKFLQTSHSSSSAPAPSSTTGTSPPRSSHATAPSSHSTTLIAHPPTLPSLPGVVNVSLDFHEDWLAPDSTADVADSEPVATPREPSRSQKVAAATAAAAESRNMPNRHSMPAAPSFVSQMWRLSSQADDLKPALESEGAVVETSEEDRETVMRRPNSMIKVEVTSEVEEKQRPSSVYKIEVQYEEEEEEEEEEEKEEKDKDGKNSDNQTHSPYIIDESCDDDFFLKSVLHKTHQSPQQRLLRTEGSGARNWSSSSYSFSSTGRTPSLSPSLTWSSSSPTSSATPSPTTPMFAPATAASSLVMIQQGLDEKRSRLSDAVKEWRRSVNLSTDSDSSMVYTGYA